MNSWWKQQWNSRHSWFVMSVYYGIILVAILYECLLYYHNSHNTFPCHLLYKIILEHCWLFVAASAAPVLSLTPILISFLSGGGWSRIIKYLKEMLNKFNIDTSKYSSAQLNYHPQSCSFSYTKMYVAILAIHAVTSFIYIYISSEQIKRRKPISTGT